MGPATGEIGVAEFLGAAALVRRPIVLVRSEATGCGNPVPETVGPVLER
jgi:hypothetical protein